MKQKLVTALLIMVCFVLQCTVFKALALASISPNLLLIVTSSLGFMRGEREGLVIGFFCGLTVDSCWIFSLEASWAFMRFCICFLGMGAVCFIWFFTMRILSCLWSGLA